ncbi:MAG TPA: hypothetical protein VEC57_20995 [Candidatus Limnocylindrales bacterium]|nr:hypothetical protein [Candidatus Limnocylindrales bacterium]
MHFPSQALPPAFRFERRAIEDREASIAAGALVMKDEDWVIVQQRGSKDESEFPALQWIAQMERASIDRPREMPSNWVRGFKDVYAAFKKGEDCQVDGYPIKNWPAITPAEAKNCARCGLHAVEDIAHANEEVLRQLGLGSRTLQQKARAFLEARANNGAASELAHLRSENEAQKQLLEEMQAQVSELRAQVSALSEPPPKRARA